MERWDRLQRGKVCTQPLGYGGGISVFEETWDRPQRDVPEGDCGQMLGRAINEAAYMIQEGICDRPEEMDLAMIYGAGFPPYRGGILRYADSWGISKSYDYLVKLEKDKGPRFKPAAC